VDEGSDQGLKSQDRKSDATDSEDGIREPAYFPELVSVLRKFPFPQEKSVNRQCFSRLYNQQNTPDNQECRSQESKSVGKQAKVFHFLLSKNLSVTPA
jgi:hypothetical protein